MPFDQEHFDENPQLDPKDGILFIDGYFFLKKNLIHQNDQFVKKAFSELYRYVSDN